MAKLTDRLNSMIGGVADAKKNAETGLQNFGKRIRKNVVQGQKDYKAGKIGHEAINPFK